jgi:predicted dienelactone hydrolase
VVLQHPGSDSALLGGATGRAGMLDRLRAGMDPRAAAARFGDVRFAIDQLTAANQAGALAGRLDLSRIGMSGHSYGALTTLVAVGQRLGAAGDRFRDPRIRAAIVYSPNAPRNQTPEAALSGIDTPILHFTGTEDRTPLDLEASPEGRQIPFRTIDRADQFLVVLNGGNHMIFSGRVQAAGGMTATQQAQTEAIQRETLTFWRAYLLGDARALAALCDLPARVRAVAASEVKATRCTAAR